MTHQVSKRKRSESSSDSSSTSSSRSSSLLAEPHSKIPRVETTGWTPIQSCRNTPITPKCTDPVEALLDDVEEDINKTNSTEVLPQLDLDYDDDALLDILLLYPQVILEEEVSPHGENPLDVIDALFAKHKERVSEIVTGNWHEEDDVELVEILPTSDSSSPVSSTIQDEKDDIYDEDNNDYEEEVDLDDTYDEDNNDYEEEVDLDDEENVSSEEDDEGIDLLEIVTASEPHSRKSMKEEFLKVSGLIPASSVEVVESNESAETPKTSKPKVSFIADTVLVKDIKSPNRQKRTNTTPSSRRLTPTIARHQHKGFCCKDNADHKSHESETLTISTFMSLVKELKPTSATKFSSSRRSPRIAMKQSNMKTVEKIYSILLGYIRKRDFLSFAGFASVVFGISIPMKEFLKSNEL